MAAFGVAELSSRSAVKSADCTIRARRRV